MLPRFISTLCAAIICGGIVAACGVSPAGGGGAPAQRTSQTYVLTQGQTVSLSPTTTLKLDKVNDSRCRPGAVCVWEGYVSFSFTITRDGAPSTFVLAEKMPGGTNTVVQQGLRFTLGEVEPAQPAALHAPPATYRVSLRVDIS